MDMDRNQWECFCALMRRVGAASLMLVATRGGGESIDSHNESVGSEVAPEMRLWRSLTLSQGTTRHDYREPDPLGRVSPLNSETGPIPTTELTLRWRGELARALPAITMQASVSYAQGQTDYSGYLQQGVTLIPYISRTGNTMQALRLRVGLPLNAFTVQPWAQHIAPYAEQSWQRWQRNLTQYGETFTRKTTTVGVMALWSLADFGLEQLAQFTLEADLATGRSSNNRMVAPALGFAANLGGTSEQSASLALRYAVTPNWLLGLQHVERRSNYGTSASVAGLQYPGASHNGRCWLVSVGTRF